jgi:hypothetical protein
MFTTSANVADSLLSGNAFKGADPQMIADTQYQNEQT